VRQAYKNTPEGKRPVEKPRNTGHPQGGVIKYQVKLFKNNSVIKVKKEGQVFNRKS
jgi:hypothetical protein